MSRENFVIKLSAKDGESVTPVFINPAYIVSIHPTDKGTVLCLASGTTVTVIENQEQLQRKGAEHGVFKFTGN